MSCRHGVGHTEVGWGMSCRGGVGHTGVGWVIQGEGGVCHAGMGGSYRGGVGYVMQGWVIQGWDDTYIQSIIAICTLYRVFVASVDIGGTLLVDVQPYGCFIFRFLYLLQSHSCKCDPVTG